jgi:hypothetical protein
VLFFRIWKSDGTIEPRHPYPSHAEDSARFQFSGFQDGSLDARLVINENLNLSLILCPSDRAAFEQDACAE